MLLGSLFDGISGFPHSACHYGIATRWASEIEPFPIKVTTHHFPNMNHLGDITKINGASIEPVNIISFGSPCQDMSVAGKRAGLEGSRSGLFMEAVRVIKEMRSATNGIYPRFVIWENVPGTFGSNNGNDFRAVLEEITEAKIPIPKSGRWAESGMVGGNGRSVAWRVLDAQYWGVPQRRKRIFLVADFGGGCAGEILFESQGLLGDTQESGEAREEVATGVGDGVEATSRMCYESGSGCISERQKAKYLSAEGDNGPRPTYTVVKSVGFAMQAIGEYSDTGNASTQKQRDYKDATDLVVCLMDVSHNVDTTLRPEVSNHPVLALENHPADSRIKVDESGTVQTLTSRMGTGGGNVPMLMQPIAFSFDSLASNSMKSKNPNNGCHITTISKTLDTTPPGPSKNQGGIAILEPIAFAANQRDEVRDLGDKAGVLQAQPGMKQQTFIAEAIPINDKATRYMGGGSTRNHDGSGNGFGVGNPGDPCPTLTAGDRHAVAQPIAFNSRQDPVSGSVPGSLDTCQPQAQCVAYPDPANTLLGKANLSYRSDVDPLVTAVDVRNLNETEELNGTLQSKNSGGYSLNYQNPIRIGYRVRRLTPKECLRLQGFPDKWLDIKGASDSSKYKAVGNSVAIPCVEFI